MAYSYSLLVIDEQGDAVLEHELTPDQAVQIIAGALRAVPVQPAHAEEEPEVSTGQHRKSRQKKGGKKASRKGGKRTVTCKMCGEQGHIAKTCPVSRGLKPLPRTGEPVERMTEDQFDELKHLQKIGDLSSKDFAQGRGLAITEVNRAIASRTFDEFRNF